MRKHLHCCLCGRSILQRVSARCLNFKMSTKFSYHDGFNWQTPELKFPGSNDKDLEKVMKVYQISPSTLETMVAGVQDWYSKQPHLPQGQLHDRMIIGHLIARGFSVEQVKERIDNYFAARNKIPEFLCGWTPLTARMERLAKEGYWMASPIPTKENYRVVIFRLLDPTDFILTDALKLCFLLREVRLYKETTIGEHWVLDASNANLNCAMQLTPAVIQKSFNYCVSCYSPKIKGIHIINVPSFATTALNIFKRIIKPKLVSRLHLYNDTEEVFKFLPRETFPKDLGGTGDFTCQDLADDALEVTQSKTWIEYFKHQEKYFYTDELKRNSPTTNGNGLEGSFRTLELD